MLWDLAIILALVIGIGLALYLLWVWQNYTLSFNQAFVDAMRECADYDEAMEQAADPSPTGKLYDDETGWPLMPVDSAQPEETHV